MKDENVISYIKGLWKKDLFLQNLIDFYKESFGF